MVSYNKKPHLGDISAGMLRRLLIVPFDQDFERNPELKIKDVYTKIRPELPGIFNRCIKAWRDVQKRGFTVSKETKEAVQDLARSSDTVYDWWCEHVNVTGADADKLIYAQCYTHYQEHMEPGISERYRLSQKHFQQRMRSIARKYREINGPKAIKLRGKVAKGFEGATLRVATVDDIDTLRAPRNF